MTVGRKFGLTTALLITLTVVLAGVGIYSITRIESHVDTITADAIPGIVSIAMIDTGVMEYRGNIWRHIASTDTNIKSALERDNAGLKKRIAEGLREYEKSITTSEDRELFSKIPPALEAFDKAWQDVCPLSREGRTAEAAAKFDAEVRPLFLTLHNAVRAESEWNGRYAQASAAKVAQATSEGKVLSWIVGLSALITGSLLTFFIVRGINATLRRALAELSDSAAQVLAAAGQVASSSNSLAQGASEQAASIEETSASTEEINSMAMRNADDSRATSDLAIKWRGEFECANEAIQRVIRAMGEITASSDKIAKIIKVIDEVAFQTNILALNAAVEAARAGESGMGFAVVADEVRNLARRSADAAKETASLIEDAIGKAREGSTRVNDVAVQMQAMNEDTGELKILVEQVSHSSLEQSTGLQQIGRAVVQIEQVTQTMAASAEEGAAAAEELNAQATNVRDIVSQLSALVGSH